MLLHPLPLIPITTDSHKELLPLRLGSDPLHLPLCSLLSSDKRAPNQFVMCCSTFLYACHAITLVEMASQSCKELPQCRFGARKADFSTRPWGGDGPYVERTAVRISRLLTNGVAATFEGS